MREVVLYTRSGCCLCDDAKEALRRARAQVEFTIREVDIESDRDLYEEHRNDIPAIDKFFSGNPPPYAVALDPTARTSQTYGTTKYPESYLIDSEGNLRLKFIGPRNWTDPAVFTLLDSYGAARRD